MSKYSSLQALANVDGYLLLIYKTELYGFNTVEPRLSDSRLSVPLIIRNDVQKILKQKFVIVEHVIHLTRVVRAKM